MMVTPFWMGNRIWSLIVGLFALLGMIVGWRRALGEGGFKTLPGGILDFQVCIFRTGDAPHQTWQQ